MDREFVCQARMEELVGCREMQVCRHVSVEERASRKLIKSR